LAEDRAFEQRGLHKHGQIDVACRTGAAIGLLPNRYSASSDGKAPRTLAPMASCSGMAMIIDGLLEKTDCVILPKPASSRPFSAPWFLFYSWQ
jgi:hypothetical protein